MNNFISLDQAIAMTTLYRTMKDSILGDAYKGKGILSISETFDAEALRTVLSNPECTGVRIYSGMNQDLQLRAIIVGVNAKNEDMLPPSGAPAKQSTADATPANYIVEEGVVCPPNCPPPSPLNP